MKRVLKFISSIIAILFTLTVVFACGYYIGKLKNKSTAVPVDVPDPPVFNLQLPGEVEKRTITKEEVQVKLSEIGELATYQGSYTISKAADYSRYFLDDILIPGTTNKISLDCEGVVKVGYNITDIVPTVDNDSRKIYIALPKPAVLDNYIIWDSVKCDDSNNILNPLEFSQYQTLITEIEDAGLAKAVDNGIYSSAEQNIKSIVKNFLSGFEDFEVVFL